MSIRSVFLLTANKNGKTENKTGEPKKPKATGEEQQVECLNSQFKHEKVCAANLFWETAAVPKESKPRNYNSLNLIDLASVTSFIVLK